MIFRTGVFKICNTSLQNNGDCDKTRYVIIILLSFLNISSDNYNCNNKCRISSVILFEFFCVRVTRFSDIVDD